MKRHLAILMIGVVFSALLTTSGCLVPKAWLDEAKRANAKAQTNLTAAEGANATLQASNQKLQSALVARDASLAAKTRQVDLLSGEVTRLKDAYAELEAMYKKEMAREEVAWVGQLPYRVDRALRRFAKDNPDVLEYLPKYGMVKMKSDMTFPSGSDAVQSGANTALGKLVTILKDPEAEKLGVFIAGHTDDVPIGKPATRAKHENNWYLSVHRAIGVQKALKAAGLSSKRIAVMGFGEHRPIAPNLPNKKGNRLNRRVEIWILPGGRFVTSETGEKK